MNDRTLYFAYGSNMAVERLRARVSSAQLLGVAVLEGHALKFHKPGSLDGSGKCDAARTGNAQDRVLGALYSMDTRELAVLDRFEACGHGYERETVCVKSSAGETFSAQAYIASHTEPSARPFDWYKEHVLRGARALGLPAAYILAIEAIAHESDTDSARRTRELAVYR